MDNLPRIVQEILRRQETKGGVRISGLEEGTKLRVKTQNSVYQINYLGEREIEVCGGMFGDTLERGHFVGSTWGTSLLKLDWIGHMMRMELAVGGRLVDTSPVKDVEIISPDDSWSYSMEWNSEDQT